MLNVPNEMALGAVSTTPPAGVPDLISDEQVAKYGSRAWIANQAARGSGTIQGLNTNEPRTERGNGRVHI